MPVVCRYDKTKGKRRLFGVDLPECNKSTLFSTVPIFQKNNEQGDISDNGKLVCNSSGQWVKRRSGALSYLMQGDEVMDKSNKYRYVFDLENASDSTGTGKVTGYVRDNQALVAGGAALGATALGLGVPYLISNYGVLPVAKGLYDMGRGLYGAYQGRPQQAQLPFPSGYQQQQHHLNPQQNTLQHYSQNPQHYMPRQSSQYYSQQYVPQ